MKKQKNNNSSQIGNISNNGKGQFEPPAMPLSKNQSLSHTIQYTKSFFSLLQKNSSVKPGTMDETQYKSFFNKTSSSGFKNYNDPLLNTKSSFNNTKTSIHSNIFITTKNRPISPFVIQNFNNNNNERTTLSRENNYRVKSELSSPPLTSFQKHRYKKSTFLDDKVLTENFFMPFETKEQRNTSLQYEKNQKSLHSISLNYLNKAVKSIKSIPSTIKMTTLEDFQAYTKKIKLNSENDRDLPPVKKTPINRRFKIKTMFSSSKNDELTVSLKRIIEKKLLVLPQEHLPTPLKINRTIMIIEDSLLDQCHHKTNLKYFFLDLPSLINQPLEKYKELNSLILKESANKLNLNSKVLYLYLKSSVPLKSVFDLPENELTIILGPNSGFQGFKKKSVVQDYNSFKSMTIINHLESTLKLYNKYMGREKPVENIPLEQKIYKDHEGLINNIVKITQGQPIAEHSQEKKLKFRNYNDYFDEKAAQETIYDTEKFEKFRKIEDLYEENLKKIKFETIENNDSSDEEVQKIRRRVSQATSLLNLDNYQEKSKKIAEALDLLFKKWLGKNYKCENDDEDEESDEVDCNLLGKNEKHSLNFVEKNQKKFVDKKRMIQLIQEENRELFIQNIPKLMKKTSFTRSEIHSTYILYKVLQEITSQHYENYSNFFIKYI